MLRTVQVKAFNRLQLQQALWREDFRRKRQTCTSKIIMATSTKTSSKRWEN